MATATQKPAAGKTGEAGNAVSPARLRKFSTHLQQMIRHHLTVIAQWNELCGELGLEPVTVDFAAAQQTAQAAKGRSAAPGT